MTEWMMLWRAVSTRRQMQRYAVELRAGVFLQVPRHRTHSQHWQPRGNGTVIGSIRVSMPGWERAPGQGYVPIVPAFFALCGCTRWLHSNRERHRFRLGSVA